MATAEVGANLDIDVVKYKALRRNRKGWVYENIKIGFPEVMETSVFVPHAHESVDNRAEINQKDGVLTKSVDLEKSDDPIAQQVICCDYCHQKRELGSYFKVAGCCGQSLSHRWIERKSMHTNTSNKTDPNLYSR